jgi:hypothetical protein
LKPCCLTNSETPALSRVEMNVVVTVLRNVGSDRRRRPVGELDTKPISEQTAIERVLHILMSRQKVGGELSQNR